MLELLLAYVLKKLVRVERNISVNLAQLSTVEADLCSRPLRTIRILLGSVMEGWCVFQIPRAECHQLGCYVAFCNAALKSRFTAHTRLEHPEPPTF
jgi:hypothetical protein